MIFRTFIFSLLIVSIISCKKSESVTPVPAEVSNTYVTNFNLTPRVPLPTDSVIPGVTIFKIYYTIVGIDSVSQVILKFGRKIDTDDVETITYSVKKDGDNYLLVDSEGNKITIGTYSTTEYLLSFNQVQLSQPIWATLYVKDILGRYSGRQYSGM